MRSLVVAFLALAPSAVRADDPKTEALKTHAFILSLHDPGTGAFKVTADGKPSLRACNGAVKAVKYLGGTLADKEKVAAFVMSRHDPATGAFAEPGGKPDVGVTSVGVMAAVELGIEKKEFAKAMDYLKANAKTFDEVRIAAAAVEAWGVKDVPFDLAPWVKVADEELAEATKPPQTDVKKGGEARRAGSVAAFYLRLGKPLPKREVIPEILNAGQGIDGGWGKAGEKGSDLESTYRVMRAYYLLKEAPKLAEKVRAFVAKCRNADGGYGAVPGQPSTMSGVYYAAIVTKWLNDLGKE
jgi:hypothetical protein